MHLGPYHSSELVVGELYEIVPDGSYTKLYISPVIHESIVLDQRSNGLTVIGIYLESFKGMKHNEYYFHKFLVGGFGIRYACNWYHKIRRPETDSQPIL